jgi:hypothetical protein
VSAPQSRPARWAHGVVIDWTLHLTRGLPGEVARDRFEQIRSDLWEQEADAGGRGGVRLAASLLLRTALGVPADLGWRRHALAAAPPPAPARARAWVPLTDERPFDQTNGAIDFDVPDAHDASDVEGDLLAKGLSSNTVNVGFFGGGTG